LLKGFHAMHEPPAVYGMVRTMRVRARRFPPHPGPLPWGEGESQAVSRAKEVQWFMVPMRVEKTSRISMNRAMDLREMTSSPRPSPPEEEREIAAPVGFGGKSRE